MEMYMREREKGFSQSALSLSQLVMYNFRQKCVNVFSQRRHLKSRETPIPLYISLKLYATVRSRTLIDRLFHLGICVPYERVLDITNAMAYSLLQKYEREKVFFPTTLRKGLYTVIAKDNIDLNASSTMIKQHYHGISMTIMQFPSDCNPGVSQNLIHNLVENNNIHTNKLTLPSDYVTLKSLPFERKTPLFAPVCTVNIDTSSINFNCGIQEELSWLEDVSEGNNNSWSKFHSNAKRQPSSSVGLNALMPLIHEKVATLEAQYHCMTVIKATINHINPGQVPVDVSDQPVYALSKEVQFRYPSQFRPGEYFNSFGDLHIEHENLIIHGELIKGSGLEDILEKNNMSTKGTHAVVDANDIKRGRYCLQVSICVIYKMLKAAHLRSTSQLSILDWLTERAIKSEMCLYWKMILEMEMAVLIFVRSIREGNFQLYLESLFYFLKWYFLMDKQNYARWATIYWFDLASLQCTYPDIFSELMKGNFSFLKTKTSFSRMALDQVHEQNNKYIKGVSGATQLINRSDSAALVRWELCGPELSRMLQAFEENVDGLPADDLRKHHEENETFQSNFRSDVDKVYNGFACNPFEMTKLTCVSNTETAFEDSIIHNLSVLEATGEKQLQSFIKDRLVYSKVSIDTKLTKNNFSLLGGNDSKQKRYIVDNRLNPTFLTKLRAAMTYRRDHAKLLFQGEIFSTAQSLSTDSTSLYHGTKADLLKRFEKVTQPPLSPDSAIVIELSAIIRFLSNVKVKTFNDFAMLVFKSISDLASSYQRVDVVADRYFKNSLKTQTRSDRGTGSSILFNGGTPFPNDFADSFLKNSDNKEKLNTFLAEKLYAMQNGERTWVITEDAGIVSNDHTLLQDHLISYSPAEEADSRLVRHMVQCVRSGIKTVTVRTVDTDVLVLLLAYRDFAGSLESDVLVYFGSGNKSCFYNINQISVKLGKVTCRALPFFFAFTGCDTVSSFYNQGKCKLWDRWQDYTEKTQVTRVFSELSNMPERVEEEELQILEKFMIFVYDPNNSNPSIEIDEYRMQEFECSTHSNMRLIPPSKIGLLEHTKRACYQAGWIWKHCTENIELPNPELWGWESVNGLFRPRWQIRKSLIVDLEELLTLTCTCKTAKCKQCNCAKKTFQCLPFCKCQRKCLS